MNITGISNNLFASNYKQTEKIDAKSAFLAVLEEKLNNNKSAETQKADDMTEAIKALDKALEKAEGDKSAEISETLLDWLKDRFSISDMAIQPKEVERTVNADGSVQVSYGGYSMSDGFNALINDLHELGVLSGRDMEVLSTKALVPVSMDNVGKIVRVEDLPFHERFFSASVNPNWRSDIAGYHRAMSEKYLDAFISGFRGTDGNSWYEEAAEVYNRLAGILDQIFT